MINPLEQLLNVKNETSGKGRDDDVPVTLSEGEYVIPADIVAFLGDGNNEAGGQILDQYIMQIREQMQGQQLPDPGSVPR